MDELIRACHLIPNFDIMNVGPTKYIRNQIAHYYLPQCGFNFPLSRANTDIVSQETKHVKINGTTVHYMPLESICKEVLAAASEWIERYQESEIIAHQCNSDGWKEYDDLASPLLDKGYVPLYLSLWCDGVLVQPSRGLSKTVIQVEFPHLPSFVRRSFTNC